MAGVREQSLQQFGPARRAILDARDSTGQGAGIASAELLDPGLEIVCQPSQCKAEDEKRKNLSRVILNRLSLRSTLRIFFSAGEYTGSSLRSE
jgi:hypothetical protein